MVAAGSITGLEAGGKATLLIDESGAKSLNLEGYWIADGAPDVHVYLTPDATGNVQVDGAVDFGRVNAISGNIVFDIPSETEVEEMRAVVIYSRAFSTTFGTAPLDAA